MRLQAFVAFCLGMAVEIFLFWERAREARPADNTSNVVGPAFSRERECTATTDEFIYLHPLLLKAVSDHSSPHSGQA